MTRRGAIWGLGALLVIGVLALWQVAVRRLDFFAVRSIEVVGLRHLEEHALVEALGIPPDAHVAIDLAPIAARARGYAGVREATVRRRLPGTLVVEVVEAPAVAIVRHDDQVVVMDDRGQALPVLPSRLTTSLPLSEQDSVVAALLGRLQATDPAWFAVIDRAVRIGGDVVLRAGLRSVRVPAGAGAPEFLDLAAVRDALEARQLGWATIDARFAGRMFVRRSPA